jgi:hypothetical protein
MQKKEPLAKLMNINELELHAPLTVEKIDLSAEEDSYNKCWPTKEALIEFRLDNGGR